MEEQKYTRNILKQKCRRLDLLELNGLLEEKQKELMKVNSDLLVGAKRGMQIKGMFGNTSELRKHIAIIKTFIKQKGED